MIFVMLNLRAQKMPNNIDLVKVLVGSHHASFRVDVEGFQDHGL